MQSIPTLLLLILMHFTGCGLPGTDYRVNTAQIAVDSSKVNHYPWLADYAIEDMLVNRIPPPKGYRRTPVTANSYADWLRHLPLKEKGAAVHLFYGGLKKNQQIHHAVVDIDTGERDLQQCADAVMRLQAEYFFSKKEYKKIHFNFTSGHTVRFDDWRKGKKPVVKGNKVTFTPSSGKADNSYRNFKKYLQTIFTFAGTKSLEKEMQPKRLEDIEIGDVFIHGGFPGHAVLVVDLAADSDGNLLMLLAQSYMPAQDIHILKNTNDKALSPWFKVDFGQQLLTPEWTFNKDEIRTRR